MLKKVLLAIAFYVIFLPTTAVKADPFKYVEIFDPKQDKVVKVVQTNQQIQAMITDWITNIDGLYKNDPATDDGYVVKISLDPAVEIKGKFLNALVSEVYILIPEKEPPCYLIFENENKLSSFPFNGDIEELSKVLDFKLKR